MPGSTSPTCPRTATARASCCCREIPTPAPRRSAPRWRSGSARRSAVIISDSAGRAFRNGVVGLAIGAAGLPALLDLRGQPDLEGRPLQVTQVGLADQIASAAELLMGEADEGRPAVLVRGLVCGRPGAAGGRPDPRARRRICSDEPWLRLSGGIGGAKLALGLYRELPPDCLMVVCNTGDDFEHLGLCDLARSGYGAVHARRHRQPGDRLGPRGRDLELHAGAGATRRRDLVPARRCRSRDPRRAHPAACRRRAPVRDQRGFRPAARRARPAPADVRRSGAHDRPDPARTPAFPALLRRAALRARGDGLRVRRARTSPRPLPAIEQGAGRAPSSRRW